MLTGAFLIEALFDRDANRRDVLTTWVAFAFAALVVALLNPDGIAGVLFPIHMLSMRSLAWIGEWEPTDFSQVQPLELILFAGLALGLTGKVRLPPVRLLILLGLIHGALLHARNEQLLGIVGVLILAEPLGRSLGRGRAQELGPPWRLGAFGAVMVAAIALALRIAVPLSPERTGAAFAAALELVPAELRGQPVLNEYGLGGELIFDGVRTFIDSRADLYGDAFLSRYRSIVAPDRGALDRALSEYGIAWTIFPVGDRIITLLDQEPGWRRLIEADGVVVHAREDRLPR